MSLSSIDPRPSVDEMSRRATRTLNGLVAMRCLPEDIDITSILPITRLMVRVTNYHPGAAERSQARMLLNMKEPGALAVILTEAADARAPVVRGYYRADGELLPREWAGELAITPAGDVIVVAPDGSGIVISAAGIGHAPQPFAEPAARKRAAELAASVWRTHVLTAAREAA